MEARIKPVVERLESIVHSYDQLMNRMADPSIAADVKAYGELAKRHKELEPVVHAFKTFKHKLDELDEYETILSTKNEDPELVSLARESIGDLKDEVDRDFFAVQRLLLPADPLDGKNIILEIRAGTGGDEAALFAAEMFRAYCRFAESRRWKYTISSINETGIGGLKEVTCVIEGNDVYSHLKYESGIHRVQRVPQTESQGRVHTSAISVVVMPEADDIDVQVKDKDLRVDTYRSSGAGGQHVNTTDSAVRITHLPSGLVVTCQDERSKIKNIEKAMRVLRSQLFDIKLREQEEMISADRKSQVGSGDRSEKIRTYNFPQGRVTDHRIKVTLYQLDQFMNGEINEMVESCRSYFEAKRLEEQLQQAE